MKIHVPPPAAVQERLRVPLSVHEDTVYHFASVDPRTGQRTADPEIEALASAVKAARDETQALVNLHGAVTADRTLTPEGGLVRLSTAALKSAERVAKTLDAQRAKVLAAIAASDKKTAAPPPPADQHSLGLASETRQALRSMSDKKRQELVAAAFARKDMAIVGAVLHGSEITVGASQAQLAIWRARYAKEFHPEVTARREQLQKALEAVDRAGESYMGFVRDLTEPKATRVAAENARRAEEALSAFNQRGAA